MELVNQPVVIDNVSFSPRRYLLLLQMTDDRRAVTGRDLSILHMYCIIRIQIGIWIRTRNDK